jgi:EmrB/QacA subfamily drug resistance transporter
MESLMNPTPPTTPRAAVDGRRWIALVVVCLAQLMMILDTTIVNVALPTIQHELRFTQAGLTWVVDAYLVAFGAFLLLAGRVGDLLGRKKVFLAGVAVFTGTSVACGLARDPSVLVVARFLQGLGGGLSSAVIIALIVTAFPGAAERARAMSVFTFVSASGGSIGLLAGGLISQSISWHWIFFVNVPIGILTIVLGAALIAENEGLGLRGGVDVLGAAVITTAMLLGVSAIVRAADVGWTSAQTLGQGGAAAALVVAFLAIESRVANPIVPLRILRLRSLMGWSAARGVLGIGLFTTFVLGALYLRRVLGYGAVATGLAFMPSTIAVGVLSLGVTARLMRRFGPRRLLAPGLVLCIAGLLVLTTAGEHAAYFPTLFLGIALFGTGAGTVFLPLLTLAMADVPPADAGIGSAITNTVLQVAAALGLATAGTIASDRSRTLAAQGLALPSALTGGYDLAFELAATGLLAGLAVVLLVTWRGAVAASPAADLTGEADREAA